MWANVSSPQHRFHSRIYSVTTKSPFQASIMPSMLAIASSLLLLTVSGAQASTGVWSKANVTEADHTLLLAGVGDVNNYASDVTTFLCVFKVDSLKIQVASGKTNYNFGVTGCNAGEEFVGRCPNLTSFAGCGSYNVVVSKGPKSATPKVTSIKKHMSTKKQAAKKQSSKKQESTPKQEFTPKQESTTKQESTEQQILK
ncbi:unnamed protein product [Phytophthora lilii]|uniref:Unnamed protein product n=1 Tax=Phytophthora lilii TaxID=2077276 RepID=A0A9W6U016_9STRA|nr:unnamed protein product [Phytophthora lilii]